MQVLEGIILEKLISNKGRAEELPLFNCSKFWIELIEADVQLQRNHKLEVYFTQSLIPFPKHVQILAFRQEARQKQIEGHEVILIYFSLLDPLDWIYNSWCFQNSLVFDDAKRIEVFA